ncbi:serine/threonine-protein kinase [Stigmatella aurantiaca]|uniref:Serine/threonine-protein kinase n=2 Tax=Stigmatella aurantiaca (strain DW4/3-1) TaxID=378806 RepID=E3FMY5_STIAD|nr:serine/threonine-protein kinase [Stigmatella aurantiaca]ADO73100.1 Serine/threonine-protein kinase [Stigmatella aurantiaca DW4/3-1]
MNSKNTRSERKGATNAVPNTARSGSAMTPEDAPPVSQVGRYILLKQLGKGGMGVVYAAYDPDLDRKVALKLLQSNGGTDSEEARARLLREAQAMARVSHPNVIPIFDVGVWGDQVFLAMEIVDGGTLASWLKEKPRSWREVLERFLAAGQGLRAAHAAGLVHRDFKPANVLVSRAGRVFVTDFGLARKVGEDKEEPLPEEARLMLPPENRMLETTLTETGLVMGTPNYMSPEQFRDAELDARSDQFSFCVALYWGLYRQRAFEPASMRSYASSGPHALGTERTEPMRASDAPLVVKASVPADIIREPPREVKVPAWVRNAVMRGLSLEPASRFSSMDELLDALSQERRLLQRRKWAVAACTAGVGLAVVAGGVYQQSQVCTGAGALVDEVWGAPQRQALEAAFVATGRPLARETAAHVAQVLDGYASDWARQSMSACVATRVDGVQPEELLARRVVCLERRRKDMRATVGLLEQADGALVEKAVEAAYALPSLQECEDAESLADQQRLPSDPVRRADIERLEGKLAEVKAQVTAGRYPAALAAARQLEASVQATGHLPLIAELRLQLGVVQDRLGESAEAARHLSQAVYDAEAGRADRLKVSILNRLIFVEDGQKHFSQASSWGGLAEATLQRLGGEPELESDLRVVQANLAISQNRFQEAQSLLVQSRQLLERVLEPGHPKLARNTFLLGRTLMELGEPKRAREMLEVALKETEAAVGPMHPDMAHRHGLLAVFLREQGDYARALVHAQAAAEIRKALIGERSVAFADALDEVGMSLMGLGRHAEALRVSEQALAVKQQVLPAEDEGLQYSYDGVGQALLGMGRARESIEPLRRAVSFASAPADVLAESGFALARALWLSGHPPEARGEAVHARERFAEAGLESRVAEVDSWLESIPKQIARRPAHPPRRPRR